MTEITTPPQVKLQFENPHYEGHFNIQYCDSITDLGNLESTTGDLIVRGCKNITSLGDVTHVGRTLFIGRSGITRLPEKLTVGRYIYVGDQDKLLKSVSEAREWLARNFPDAPIVAAARPDRPPEL